MNSKVIDFWGITPETYIINEQAQITNTKTGNVLNGCPDKDGYLRVSLKVLGNKRKTFKIHRLVAKAFIETEDDTLQVNHIDGIKTHNYVSNLEWVTPLENISHAIKTGLRNHTGENHFNNIYSEDMVHEICKLIERGCATTTIIKHLGLENVDSISWLISDIKKGKNWTHISNQYTFPKEPHKAFKSKSHSYEMIDMICKLLLKRTLTTREIVETVFGEHKESHMALVRGIKNNKKYRSVSSLYW